MPDLTIALAPGLNLPIATAASQKYAILGRTGSGKSYAASKLVEELLGAGSQVVVIDPVGVWYGLRLSADGKGKGISIPILGGSHGDYPLESTAGELVAGFVVENSASIILDTSEFTGGEQRKFVTAFATQLLQLKKSNRSPLLLVLEEAQEFVPQRVFADAAKMVGAFERLIKLGRNFGLGAALISQRPQAINKDVLNQTEVLFVYQLTGPQERKTIDGWIVDNALDLGAVVDELPSLPTGTGFVWSPQWLKICQKVRVYPKKTFDASATPIHKASATARVQLAPIDLESLNTRMAALIESTKADDPSLLRKRIAQLEKQLADKPKAEIERVEVPVLTDEDKNALEAYACGFRTSIKEAQKIFDRLAEIYECNRTNPHAPRYQSTVVQAGPITVTTPAKDAADISKAQQKILNAMAELKMMNLDAPHRSNIAVSAGQSPKSSAFSANLSFLKQGGYIEAISGNQFRLTDLGQSAAEFAGNDYIALTTLWLSKFSGKQHSILDVLVKIYPEQVSREELAEMAGQSITSSAFGSNLSELMSWGLIEYPTRGNVRCSEMMFPKGG